MGNEGYDRSSVYELYVAACSVYVVICLNTDDNVRGLCNTIGHAV